MSSGFLARAGSWFRNYPWILVSLVLAAVAILGAAFPLAKCKPTNSFGALDILCPIEGYPPPWTWVCYVLALSILWLTLRPARSRAKLFPGVADRFERDQPIRSSSEDKLQRRSIARSLSRFLSNEDTMPPLTVAITGAWGQGKSSLMNLVKEDLDDSSFITVWFNAWHHQKESHLFAALMQAIRDQVARGPLFSGSWEENLSFRARILRRRVCERPLRFLISMAIVALFLIFWASNGQKIAGWISDADGVPDVLNVLGYVVPLLSPLIDNVVPTLRRLSPARLLSVESGISRVRTFDDRLGFRHRFGEALAEVNNAIYPRRIAIFVDDLDRCRPDQVVETLEAINYLVDVGRCYIIIGVDPAYLIGCISHEFKRIAEFNFESQVFTGLEVSSSGVESESEAGHRGSIEFARKYLEKLVNVELAIPEMTTQAAARLLPSSVGADRRSETGRVANEISGTFRTLVWIVGLGGLTALVIGGAALLAAGELKVVEPPNPLEVSVSTSSLPDAYTVQLAAKPSDSVLVTVKRATDGNDKWSAAIESPWAPWVGDGRGPELQDRQTSQPGITPSRPRVTPAEGSRESFTVVLNTRPSAPVKIMVAPASGGDSDLVVIGGSSLTFTPATWNVPQRVTVSAAEDADREDGTAIIEFDSWSEDDSYEGVLATVEATEKDNDVPDVEIRIGIP